MKTSNKLLTALAVLLIIIPIIVVAINVKINYKHSIGDSFVEEQELNEEPFDKESSGRTSIPIKTAFSSVNIPDAKRNVLQIHFIKSAMSGVKVPTEMKNEISFSVDNMGVLKINVGDKLKTSGYHRYGIAILIYGPNINGLSLNNSTSLVLTAKTDTLNVNMKRSGSLSFGSPITFSVNDKITRVINQTDIKQLNVKLDSASFYSSNSSYKSLTITSKNSSVDIRGDENSNNSIENLTINTFEKSDIKIENVIVNKMAGSLSDETTVGIPVKYLKQIFKK
ncbi:hypothetical protein EZ456_07910 [Pedobacter psychrodurus]|uniref:Uncharacterized protein n=1 Tax=Pedobacter psychrodurus TaxID=2530456 RepID=A0A4R0PY18_9SPHI|nr:hypothetical protein [Pedobacter psychrodurus]TCD27864.1 hypothetical protein EZ456_07910 [Pedobacter psychrodurus]